MAADAPSNGRFGSINGRDKARFRFQSWTTTDDSDGFTNYEARSEHVCRPVIIGSDGRAIPAVFDCPPGHQHHHHNGEVATGIGGNGRWEQSGDFYRPDPYKAQGQVSSVQTAADGRFGLPGGRFQREKFAEQGIYSGSDGDGDMYYRSGRPLAEPQVAVSNGSGWARDGRTAGWGAPPQREKFAEQGIYSGSDGDGDMYYRSGRPLAEPQVAVSNGSGWGRDGRTAGWGVPPPPVGALGRVTNDIGAATEFIRESGFPAAQAIDRWSSHAPASTHQPSVRKKSAGSVIDSREAAKKYGGQVIW